MAIGVDQIYLSMTSPETGEYLTANVYTVDGVFVPASGAYSFQLDPENLPSCITADYMQGGLAIIIR